jgi:hypothetical protein
MRLGLCAGAMRSIVSWSVLGVVLASATGSGAARGSQEQAGKASEQGAVQEFSIGGVVVDSVAGRGVGHALVVLTMYADPKTRGGEQPMRRVMADEEGRFEFRGLTSTGRAGIQAAKAGYEAATDVRTGLSRSFGGFQELNVEPGVNVTVTLVPEATIAGRVVDASGEPIEKMPIHLTIEGAVNGRRVAQDVRRGVRTNEEGEFRFADLQAGRYFVSAGPSEEVSSRSAAGGRTALGYATVFYGGGSDYATASPIDLTAGKHVDVDLRMELQPLFKVSGVISGGLATGLRQIAIFNAANQRLVNRSEERSDQEFQIAELPRGSYTLHVSSLDTETRECTATIKRLNLTRDVSGLQLALSPCATVTVNIHVEHAKPETNKTPSNSEESGSIPSDQKYPVQSSLRPNDERGMSPTYHGMPTKDEPDKAIARGVAPGRYIVEVPLIRKMYVESMQSGMTDLLREDLVVAPGVAVAPVDVRLRDDGALLDGEVNLGPDVKTAAVIAIPVETPRLARNAIVLSGQFNFRPLAPGRYELFAVDRLNDFAYAEQDVIGKYLAHAKEVTLRANERTTVELEFVRVGREGQP